MRLPKLDPALLREHHVLVKADDAFQQRARLTQALWRERHGHPIGLHRGAPLGSSMDLDYAERTLANFLTETIRDVVRDVLRDADPGALISERRLYANLLSSQPLCFNLFGELARDLDLATAVFRQLAPGRVARVTEVAFEHSPGRGDPRFTGDRSAFDVFVRYASAAGRPGFLGIEVKYHEALGDAPAEHRPRYDELADAMGIFPEDRAALKRRPLQQIWRDHLLAGALLTSDLGYEEGVFVLLHPEGNTACANAVGKYRAQLRNTESFTSWTLEEVIAALRSAGATWAELVQERYLARS